MCHAILTPISIIRYPLSFRQGDSGGPLEVKLLHNTKVTPFIVAITSFGTACGQSLPGVYTKISSYIPWIRSVLEAHGEEAPGIVECSG